MMMRPHPAARLGLRLIAISLFAGAPAALGQSVGELQDELARTREELRLAEMLIATLRQEVARLQAELSELKGEESIEPRAELPTDPLACPDCMAAELARRYERDLARLVGSVPEDRFEEIAAEWCEEMSRSVRGRREWLVLIADVEREPGSRDSTARIRVYDEVSLLPLGDAELVSVPARFAARLDAEPQASLWRLTAEVSADPVYDPSRASRGVFDEPPFVGPYIESGFALDWIGLEATEIVPTDAAAAEPPAPIPPTPPAGPDR